MEGRRNNIAKSGDLTHHFSMFTILAAPSSALVKIITYLGTEHSALEFSKTILSQVPKDHNSTMFSRACSSFSCNNPNFVLPSNYVWFFNEIIYSSTMEIPGSPVLSFLKRPPQFISKTMFIEMYRSLSLEDLFALIYFYLYFVSNLRYFSRDMDIDSRQHCPLEEYTSYTQKVSQSFKFLSTTHTVWE